MAQWYLEQGEITVKLRSKLVSTILLSSFIPVHLQQDTFEPVCAFLSNNLPNFDAMHDMPFNSKVLYNIMRLVQGLLDTISVSLPDCTSDSSANTLPM